MMDTNSPEFVSLLGAATWWRDYAVNLSQGRSAFPDQPYPALYPYTPYPPPGVTPQERPGESEPADEQGALVKRLASALEEATGRYGPPTDLQRNRWMRLVLEARKDDQK